MGIRAVDWDQPMKAIRVNENGGPEVLRYEETPEPAIGPAQALVEIEVAGVNYIDTYHRYGYYPVPVPFTPGVEGAGTVLEVGAQVEGIRAGDRVSYAMILGSYAQRAAVDASKLIVLPDEMETSVAATLMVQGLTAHYLAHGSYPLGEGDTALVHAAAGGVGLLLVQIAKLLGASVIGTVSTEAKAELARQAGADHVILYTEQDFQVEVERLTGGAGVHVVYDSVAKTTFERSLNCLRPRGYLVLFGQSSGPVDTFDPQVLNQKGSLFLTRPSLNHYALTREELMSRADDLFAWYAEGDLKVRIGSTYPLAEAEAAHRALEGRKTTGKVLLLTS